MQPVLPLSGVNFPAGESWQTSVPVLAANDPGRHAMHTLASMLPGIGFAVPSSHAMQDASLDAMQDASLDAPWSG